MTPLSLEEQEPGVYVRSDRPSNELDFLWDRERKKGVDQDRFNLGFFLGGFFVGSLATLAGCLLYFSGMKMFIPAQDAEKPPVIEERTLDKTVQSEVPVKADSSQTVTAPEPVKTEAKPNSGFQLPFFSSKPKQDEAAKTEAPELKARTYEVQSGDTLGSIAIKFYNSSSQELMEKIKRANNMQDADSLQIGQKLTIPPKSY